MDFGWDPHTEQLRATLLDLMETQVHPAEPVFARELGELEDPWAWSRAPVLATLREEAKARGLFRPVFTGVANDPDDRQQVQVPVHVAELNGLPDRVLARPPHPGERLVDERHVGRLETVTAVEEPAAAERDAERLEIRR